MSLTRRRTADHEGPSPRSSSLPADTLAAPSAPPKVFFTLLDQLRAIAALLVVWSHLVGFYLETTGRIWEPKRIVDFGVTHPLGVIHDYGWMGVAIFFFISGFVITHAARRESRRVFIARRLLRIYPPLIFGIALAIVVAYISGTAPTDDAGGVLSVGDVIANLTLGNQVVAGTAHLLTVTWTLAVEMFFYLGMWALLPLVKSRPWIVSLAITTVSLAISAILPAGAGGFRPADSLVFVPLLVVGQLVYAIRMSAMRLWVALLLGVYAWGAFLVGLWRVYPDRLNLDNNYPSNAAIALALIAGAVLLEGRVRPSKLLGLVARRSYSLYLVHGPLGLLVLFELNRIGVPYTINLLLSLVVVAAVTELSYRVVELPGIRLGRAVSGFSPRDTWRRIRHPGRGAGRSS